MTAYNAITDSQCDPDAPLTSQWAYQNRDNPIAMAEGSPGAPYVAAGWHPYDGVLVGDSADGVIYDFAVDGAVASIETPNFVDGYEYYVTFDGLDQTASNRSIEFYMETSASWSTPFTIGVTFPNDSMFEIYAPRMVSNTLFFRSASVTAPGTNGTVTGPTADLYSLAMTTAQKIQKARFDAGASSFNGGKIRMFKRRCYA